MNYITIKAFNKKGIDGDFSLPLGTVVTETNNVIYHGNKRICFVTSQNAYDYFSRNDDNHGTERYALIESIKAQITEYVSDYNEDVAAINNSDRTDEEKEEALAALEDNSYLAYEAIRNNSTTANLLNASNMFNYNFYNASIETLELVEQLITNL